MPNLARTLSDPDAAVRRAAVRSLAEIATAHRSKLLATALLDPDATVRAAVKEAGRRLPDLPLFAGGKSFGGRMTSQAQAASPLPGVRGLVFLGFPLHPAGKPDSSRAEHLFNVTIPMLFLQGKRDALAHPEQLRPVMERLRDRATLRAIDQADHSFHVPARGGHTDAGVMAELLDTIEEWMAAREHA